jgi:hypothetical protein
MHESWSRRSIDNLVADLVVKVYDIYETLH